MNINLPEQAIEMLCFVMALKSKQVSNDWSRVCQLFEASLISAFRQTDPDLKWTPNLGPVD